MRYWKKVLLCFSLILVALMAGCVSGEPAYVEIVGGAGIAIDHDLDDSDFHNECTLAELSAFISDGTLVGLDNTQTLQNKTMLTPLINTILGYNDTYIRIGDVSTTTHSLDTNDDLYVSGKLEIDGYSYFDAMARYYDGFKVSQDDRYVSWGSDDDAKLIYESADINAKSFVLGLPTSSGDANNVPVFVIGDIDVINYDLGFFNGYAEPNIAIIDADKDSYATYGYSADDNLVMRTNRQLHLFLDNDIDDFFKFRTVTDIPTIYGIGAYIRIGDASTTSRSLSSEDDLMISGKLEVDGYAYFDGDMEFLNNAQLSAQNSDGCILNISARDTGVGRVTIGKLVGAGDPYFAFGGSNQVKHYNSGWTSFDEFIYLNDYLQFTEMSAVGAGGANTTRVYAVEGGDTLTDLCAVFQDGSVDIFAQETTELDSPIFTFPSQTEGKLKMVKPHAGIIRFVFEYPDGETYILKELNYHDEDKIEANKGCENELPLDWFVESVEDRIERLVKEEVDRLLNADYINSLIVVEEIEEVEEEIVVRENVIDEVVPDYMKEGFIGGYDESDINWEVE